MNPISFNFLLQLQIVTGENVTIREEAEVTVDPERLTITVNVVDIDDEFVLGMNLIIDYGFFGESSWCYIRRWIITPMS